MRNLFKNTIFYIIYSIGILLVLPFFVGWKLYANNDDLLKKIAGPAYDAGNIIKAWESVDLVGANVLKWSNEIGGSWVKTGKSIVLTATRFLLILTVALAVTMILYNGMMYIIQTWQGQEWKSLVKNVALIVVGILIALFSVVIINLIQSIPNELEQLQTASSDKIKRENENIKWSKMSWREVRESFSDMWCEIIHRDETCRQRQQNRMQN